MSRLNTLKTADSHTKKWQLLLLFIIIMSGLNATPQFEGFEGTTFPPAGWTVVNGGDANTWVRYPYSWAPYTGAACASITYSYTAHDDWLITPMVHPTAGDATFSFWARNTSSYYIDRFNVKLSNTNSATANFTVNLASNIGPGDTYTLYTYNLTAYIGQSVYIGIQAISTDMAVLCVDDIIYPAPDTSPGSELNPFQITTAAELSSIRNYLGSANGGKHFKLMNDIDMLSYLSPGGAGYTAWGANGWLPIGNATTSFYGNFDGNNHTISNLRTWYYGANHGLFGVTAAGSTVKNLNLSSNCTLLGDGETGSVAGRNNGIIRNCSSAAAISIGNAEKGGGITGNNTGSVFHSRFTGTITRSGGGVTCNKIGGIAGNNETGAVIDSCYSGGSITGNYWNGGLVGWNNGTITRSHSTGSVNGASNSQGGLVGQNNGAISNCYSTATAYGYDAVGGLVGYQGGGSTTYCYATGSVSNAGSAGTKGGLIGTAGGGTVANSYWDKNTTGLTYSSGSDAAFGKTTAEMKALTTYSGWDFAGETANGTADHWYITPDDNSGYPFLCWEHNGEFRHPVLSYPADAATEIPLNGFDLTWSVFPGGQVPVAYNVYMIQSSPTHIFETGYAGQHTFTGITGTSYNPVTSGGILFDYNQTWYWTVKAVFISGELAADSYIRSFTIPTDIIFTDGFETGNTHGSNTIANWTQALGSGANYWTVNSAANTYNRTPRTGSLNATLYYPGDCWLFRPVALTAGQPYRFELYARQDMEPISYANIGLYYGTSGTVAAMTNTIVAQRGLTNGDYQLISGTFVPTATGTYYLGIHGWLNYTPYYISLDDISLRRIPQAPPLPVIQVSPADLAINQSILPILTWNEAVTGGHPTTYKVYCQASTTPIIPTTLIATVNTTNNTFTPTLEYNTTYYWMVVPTNAYGDAVGSTVSSFTTGAPLNENFSGTFPPANWTLYAGVLNLVTTLTPDGGYWYQDYWCNVTSPVNKSAKMHVWGNGQYGWLVTPPIRMGEAENTLELDIALTDYNNSNAITTDPNGTTGIDDRFVILIGDGVSWSPANIVREWNNTGSPYVYNSIPSTGLHVQIPVHNYTGIKYVAFYASSSIFNASNDLFVDNVQVTTHIEVFSDGFEAGNTNGSTTIANWTQALGSGANNWTANNNGYYYCSPRTGAFNATLLWGGDCWLFRPVALTAGQPYRFELYARQDWENTSDANIGLYYGTSGTVAAMTNTITAQRGLTDGDYQLVSGTFVPPATGTYYLGIHGWLNPNPSYLSMDDISLRRIPLALPQPVVQVSPANLATNQNILPTLTWNEAVTGGHPTSYKVYCQASATPITPTTLIATVNVSPYTFTTALEYITTYYWMVVPTNAYGDAVGSTVSSFTTGAPLNENFSGTFPPADWTLYTGVLDLVTTLNPTTFSWYQDDWRNVTSPVNKSAKMEVWGNNSYSYGWLVTPPIRMGEAENTLELDIALTDYNNSNAITTDPNGTTGIDDRFVILIGDGVSWSPANICKEWNNTGSLDVYNSIPSTGLHVQIPVHNYTGIKYVAFYASSSVLNASNDLFVDNVQLTSVIWPTDDLAVRGITGPNLASVGTPVTHTVTVTNNGTAPQTGYTVSLKTLSPATTLGSFVMPALAAFTTVTHDFTWTPTAMDSNIDVIYAEVTLAADTVPGNNVSPNFPIGILTGAGTEADPYQVISAEDLSSIRNLLGAANAGTHFKLMNDIDLTSYLASGGAGYTAWGTNGWLPIGTSTSAFYGHFDGDNHVISGLKIERLNTSNCGLWGYTETGSTLENTSLETTAGSWVKGFNAVGMLVGYNKGAVSNCSARGSVRGITWSGGLIGWNDGTINRCFTTGDVIGTVNTAGGLVGQHQGTITNSYSRASAAGVDAIGGLVGNQGAGSTNYCFATGSVTSTGSNNNKGGIIGTLYAGTVSNSYWDTQTTELTYSSGSDPSFGKTTAEMKTQGTFTGWDFTTVWTIDPLVNNGYPQLAWAYIQPAAATPTNVVIQSGTTPGTVTLSWDSMNAAWYGIYGGTTPDNLTYLGWTGNQSISLIGSSMGFYKVTSGSGTAPGVQLTSRETLPLMVIPPAKPHSSIRQRKNQHK